MSFQLAVRRFNSNINYSGLRHAVTEEGWFFNFPLSLRSFPFWGPNSESIFSELHQNTSLCSYLTEATVRWTVFVFW